MGRIKGDLQMITETKQIPCNLDHNGECLICDCWISDCAYQRYLNKDYTYETEDELEQMFKNFDPTKNEK